mgnify:CR=1 FL=1
MRPSVACGVQNSRPKSRTENESMSSLIPERHLVVSPSLAATIGLEEAVLLSYLADLANFQTAKESQGYQWFESDIQQLSADLAFWSSADMQRICESLRDKGVLLVGSAPITESGEIRFAFNQSAVARESIPANHSVTKNTASADTEFTRANRIAPSWQPDNATLRMLSQQGVPSEFTQEQVPSFVQYWVERGESRHAWGNRFLKQVLREWNRWQAEQNRTNEVPSWEQNNSAEPVPIKFDWQPSDDALDILVDQAGVSRSFIEDAVPEFVLYWREKGDASNTWNARFITHVKRQWARYQHTVENDVDPKPMGANWKPNQDVYDVLRLARIDLEFAREKIPEFIIYWRDRNEVRASWNTTYLQFIKHQWQTAHESATNQTTRARRLIDDLTDTSWAD